MAPRSRRAMGFSPITALLAVFWLFSSFALAANAVIGIDFGTEYITAALVKPGIPLDIVLTKDSRRKELSAVAFKPIKGAPVSDFPERLYGSDAVALSARFPGDVYPNLRAILGLSVDDVRVKEFHERYPGLMVGADKTRNTVQFNSGAFGADADPWMVEEILAMELQSIQKNAELMAGKGSIIKDVVITIPPYFDAEEKRAMLLAADLAGLRVLSLITDGLSVGLNYATTRTFPSVTEGGKPEVNLLFDMGAGSTKATVLRFQGKTVKNAYGSGNKTVQEIEVLGSGWDRTLGGDALNKLIVDDMVEKFAESKAAKKENVDPALVKAHGRAMAMLWKSAEKLRQVLSANVESQANFEGVYNDIDFRYKLTRADFEKFAAEHAARVQPVVEAALRKAGLEITDIDSVILTGGGTRTPFIQKELKKIVGEDRIKTNVNADEAAVFGAAFKGAGLSPSFRVKEIRTHEAAQHAVGMKWTNVNLKDQKQRLFSPQSHLGVEKIVSFQNLEDFDVHFYQQVDEQNNGKYDIERPLAKLNTKNLTAAVSELKEKHKCKSSDIITKFGVRLSLLDGEVEVTTATVQCESEHEEKKGALDGVKGMFGFGKKDGEQEILADSEIVSDAPTESSTESTTTTGSSASSDASASSVSAEPEVPKKRTVVIPVGYTVEKQGYPPLPKSVLAAKKDRLRAFDNSDKKRQQREEALNQLEAFTYRIRDKLDDESFISASAQTERTKLSELASAASEWLYGEGADATREVLRLKLKELTDLITPIERRREEAIQRPIQVQLFRDALKSTSDVIEKCKKEIIAADAYLIEKFAAEKAAKSGDDTEPAVDAENLDMPDEEAAELIKKANEAREKELYPVSEEEVNAAVEVYENAVKWLEEKLAAQAKLLDTEEPAVTSKELAEKANEITKMSVELIMKSMKKEQAKEQAKKEQAKKSRKSAKAKKTKSADSEEPKKSGATEGEAEAEASSSAAAEESPKVKDEL